MLGDFSSSRRHDIEMLPWRALRNGLLATTALVSFSLSSAGANPLGPSITGGSANITGLGTNSVVITQTSPRTVIDWRSFNISTGEITRFVQPNAGSVVLNRVTGNLGPSTIDGTLLANGRVFLINPYGILIGGGAVINTASFLATTNDIKNADFLAGRYNFTIPGRPDASIVNLGTITASNMGFAALVAPGVRNAGTITANFGRVALASGNTFSLDFYGDRLITLSVSDSVAASVKDLATGQTLGSLVKNEGKLKANGGQVQLSAVTARQVVDSVINNRGVIEARTIGRHQGKIVLGGPVFRTKIAGAPVQTVRVSGTLDVSGQRKGTKAGTIQITGEDIQLSGATLKASGWTGGGTVLIGGDTGGGNPNALVASIPQAKLQAKALPNATTVSIDASTIINASATNVGDAGKVVVWADGNTNFAGTIIARGAPVVGNGGFVEVSGHQQLTFNGRVDLAAPNGTRGTLLLDPLNATIDTTAGAGVITVASIQNALASGDVVVTTLGTTGAEAGDITVKAPVTWSSSSGILIAAHRNIVVNANLVSTGGGDVHLLADVTGTGIGTVTFGPGAVISTSGSVSIAFNPSVNPVGSGINPTSYVSPVENFSANVVGGATLTQSMLVNTPSDLQNVTNNLSANYALGRDINMSGVVGFVPIGNGNTFTGQFAGLDRSILNLSINSSATNVGLFSKLGSSALVSDLKLNNIQITATSTGSPLVGTVAGSNLGEVFNVTVTSGSTITVVGSAASQVGGLVGFNGTSGNVNSNFAVSVSIDVSGVSNVKVGGLVGANDGFIGSSSYNGTILAGTGFVGGVVGVNTSSVQNVSASGNVNVGSVSGTVRLGGVVGLNDAGASIINSVALSNVTAFATGGVEVGGFAGANSGFINQSYARGNVAGGTVGTAGGLVGHNNITGSVAESYATGTVAGVFVGGVFGANDASPGTTNVYWNTTTSGLLVDIGTGNATTATGLPSTGPSGLTTTMPPGFGSSWIYTSGFNSNFPHQVWETQTSSDSNATVLQPGVGTVTFNDPNPFIVKQNDDIRLDKGTSLTLINLTLPDSPPATVTTRPILPTNGQPFAPPQTLRPISGPDDERYSSMPPLWETRFRNDEVLLQFNFDVPADRITEIANELGLQVIEQQTLTLVGRTTFRFRLPPRLTVREAIRLLEQKSIVAIAQPHYGYVFAQQQAAPAAQRGDPAQYMLDKFSLHQVHMMATGNGITVAVIDSEVDKKHSELSGAVSEELNATGGTLKAHPHGTAMAGAIASRDRLLGVAPNARIIAVRAFGEASNTAEGTTYNILKGIEWAVSQNARVINMSFAGPFDPSVERAIKAATQKGIIVVAAAGNAGPKARPAFPGADTNVIGVTATDSNNKLFRQANQGDYVSVASPGVDILAPAPDETYQMSTGTSIATAHVSGVVALMLERDPKLTPADARQILESTATDLGPRGKDPQFGWGLVNPQKALQAVEARKKAPSANVNSP